MTYDTFAGFYDRLTENVGYEERADYFCSLLSMCGVSDGIMLDLACGTGSLSVLMAERGFDVIGADISSGMLSLAREKARERKLDILWLCTDMCEIDLYGTVDCCICALDSINHLPDLAAVRKAFEKVALFMNDGGAFVFDVNTKYKHREVLADNAFTYDLDGLFCAWQNEYNSDDDSVNVYLDFFCENDDGTYERYCEDFSEQAYELSEIQTCLEDAGFNVVAIYDDLTLNSVTDTTQRAVFTAVRKARL